MANPPKYKRKVIFSNEMLEIVQIIWPPGSKSAPHDHGISQGKIWVIRGKIFQKIFSKSGKKSIGTAMHFPGEIINETPDLIHIMGNLSTVHEEAETLHIYWPPLKMNEYDPNELKYP